jgi:hypothetical protein
MRVAREGSSQRGPVPVQLRLQSGHTSSDYVTLQRWRNASLPRCPLHPKGGCGFARHGTYARVDPPGTRIARWYCPTGHCTFSLLPDHLAARFPGTLAEIEAVVAVVEDSPSLEAAANALRTDDVTLATALRWIRRRTRLVRTTLTSVVSLLPDLCLGTAPTIHGFRLLLAGESVLMALREITMLPLADLPRPLGFRPPPGGSGGRKSLLQQHKGPDPPVGAA